MFLGWFFRFFGKLELENLKTHVLKPNSTSLLKAST